jgi:hypothetical protein
MTKKPDHPAWFTVRFDQTLEWAALRVPEEHVVEWLLWAARLLETPLWRELLGIHAILRDKIIQQDWPAVSPWRMVHHLKVAQDVKAGMRNFLPGLPMSL